MAAPNVQARGSCERRGCQRNVALVFIGLVICALGICRGLAWAQMTTGTILGTVTDTSGAAVPGAKITITNVGTQISQALQTDSSGSYVVPTLIPGTYNVTAEKAGFQRTVKTGIILQVDQKARVDLTLQVGSVTQTVEVTGQAPLVQTESSEQAQVITSQQIVGLPLNIRNFAQLVSLDTGAVPNPGGLGGNINPDNPQGISDTNVNGIQTDANNWQIDGISDNEAFFSILSVNPSIDAIQEFKVSTNDYSAEFGRAGGANVQIAIKSGTNSFHGVGFEFLRNSKLDASDFFTNKAGGKIPPFKQNQFGANLGGPIKKDRTFFFGDYEGYRSRLGETELMTIPSMLQRQGIFTEAGNPVIYNPYDVDPATNHPRPFANNTIPHNLIDSAARKVMALLPPPNLTAPIGQPNFAGSHSIAHDVDNFDVRVDHRLTDKDQFFVRYSYLSTLLNNPPFLGTVVGGDPFLAALANTRNQNGVISDIHMFSPRTINEFRIGINRVRTDWTPFDQNLKTSDQVGIPGINSFCGFCGGLARIQISGMSAFGHTPFAPTFRHDTIFQWVDNVTFIRGRHTIKTGADIRRIRAELYQTANPIGEFDFDERFTSGLGAAGTGFGLASFLLGPYEFAGRAAMPGYPSNRGNQLFFFGQDDFKVNEKLTLNLGLRYEYYSPITDAHKNLSQFDLGTGDILLACIATTCSGGVRPDRKDWAPRLGFAYSPDRGRTAIRGGFGISYFSPGFGGQMGTLNDNFPFVRGQGLTPANNLTLSPADPVLSEGLPALSPVENRPGAPPGHLIPTGGASGGGFSSVFYMDQGLKMTRVYQWSLDLQRSITPNLVVDAAYVGNSANHLFLNIPGNYPEPGVVTTTGLSLQQARPYYSVDPDLAGFTKRLNGGNSSYHSFQLKVEKRFSSGFSFLSSYTVSKVLSAGYNYVDPDHYMAGKSPSGFDTPQRLVLSYLYELPFGQNKHWGKSWNRMTESALGGWQVNGITTYMTGFPFQPSITSTLDNGNGNVPNRICSGRASNPTIYHWFDPGCFVAPPTNVFGNMGFGILRGPGYRDWDLGLLKNFTSTESRYLQFRVEFFNLPNNVNFGQPNSFLCGGACGEGTINSLATGSQPRQIQFALKFYF
jgi:carboxypeptidase family protein/TonB-dependent receptor-like protein